MEGLRPEGWKNPYADTTKHYPFEHSRPVKIAHDAYECGADAMLKALSHLLPKGHLVLEVSEQDMDIEVERPPALQKHTPSPVFVKLLDKNREIVGSVCVYPRWSEPLKPNHF